MYHFIEKIKFGCSKQTPISKKSLLGLIPEIINEKIEADIIADIDGLHRMTLDEFLLKFLKDKLKLTKIAKKNCEKILLSILKYATEDIRIDIIRRFIGLGDSKIEREVLDCFLNILKNLPISFYKIFEETEDPYIMDFENSFDIYNNNFPYYFLPTEALENLLRSCEIYEGNSKIDMKNYEKIRDLYFLFHFYNKNTAFIESLLNDYKSKRKSEEDLLEICSQFMIANNDYEIKLNFSIQVFKNNFKINSNNTIDLDSLFTYFLKKIYFKIKIMDYLCISLELFNKIYNGLDKILSKMWEKADLKRQGIIFYKEFEQVLSILLGNSENKWKIVEYFK